MLRILRLAPLAIAGLLLAETGQAAEGLYCCRDDKGRKLCSDRLPKACIGKPHTIRGADGRITKVDGFLSPAERRAREAEEQRQKEAAEAAAEANRRDRALLATYGNVRDIENARERNRAAVQRAIDQAQERIEAAKKRRAKYESEAEFYRKKTVPAEIKRGIRDAETEIKSQTELIAVKQKELDSVDARYNDEKERYLKLTVRSRGDRLER